MDCTTAHVTCKAESICDTNSLKDIDESKEAEGVWSQDIEKSFQEAMDLYPPCGRRKIVLSEEGKMYGRNELIARHIKMQTGKVRSRKQVSSHIQVLARRKAKELQAQVPEKQAREQVRQTLAHMSSAQIVSDTRITDRINDELLSMNNNRLDLNFNTSNNHHGHPTSNLGPLTPTDQNLNTFLCPSFLPPPPSSHTTLPHHHPLHAALWQARHPPNNSTQDLPRQHHQIIQNHLQQQQHQLRHTTTPNNNNNNNNNNNMKPSFDLFTSRSISTKKIRLAKLTAFSEMTPSNTGSTEYLADKWNNNWIHVFAHLHTSTNNLSQSYLEKIDISEIWDKYPEHKGLKEQFETGPSDSFFMVKFWIDVKMDLSPQWSQMSTIIFESTENIPIRLSTKLCSFGKEVLERIEEKLPEEADNGIYVYNFERVPMCEYMRKFMVKLSELQNYTFMNSVLENFTILMTVTNILSDDILLCIAFAMEVSQSNEGSQYHIYKLVQSNSSPRITVVDSSSNESKAQQQQQLPRTTTQQHLSSSASSSSSSSSLYNNNMKFGQIYCQPEYN